MLQRLRFFLSPLAKQFLNVGSNLIPHVQLDEWPIPAALAQGVRGVSARAVFCRVSELDTKTITGTFCVRAVRAKTSLNTQVLCFLLASGRARATKGEGEDNSSGGARLNADKQKELAS